MARRRPVGSAAPVVVIPAELVGGSPVELMERYVSAVERSTILEKARSGEDESFAALAAVAHRRLSEDRDLWRTQHGLGWFEFCRLRREQVRRGAAT